MINLKCEWKGKMKFEASSGTHSISMDAKAPLGDDAAMTPKQLLLAAVCGCTAMDVVALMKKHKQNMESFVIDAQTELTQAHPSLFSNTKLIFRAQGQIEKDKLLEAVNLSQTKYCGVTAMISKAVSLDYDVELNGEKIGSGKANFQF